MWLSERLNGLTPRGRYRRDGRSRGRRGEDARRVILEVVPLEARALLSSNVLGSETRINDIAAGVQRFTSGNDSSLAVDLDGNVIAVWSASNPDGRGTNIIAQRVDPEGNPLGAEIVVNTGGPGSNRNPVVAASIGNTFVVAWEAFRNAQDRSGLGIFARVYDLDGTALTEEFLVNGTTRGSQRGPSVEWLTSETFVVSWDGGGRGTYPSAFARVFQDTGAPLTAELHLSDFHRSGQREVAVAALPNGGFQAVWSGPGAGDRHGIFSRLFDSLGQPLGGAFRVNTARATEERSPTIALVNNQIVIAWHGRRNALDRRGLGVIARRFDLNGSPLGPEFLINQSSAGDQRDVSIAPLADGGFVAAWEGPGVGDDHEVFIREFNADGSARGDEQVINTTEEGLQHDPSVHRLGAGYAVAWSGTTGGTASEPSDRYGIALRTTEETPWPMPTSSVGTRDDVMTFTIPEIGVVSEVSPKTITFTNTTNRTIYPILEAANNNVTTITVDGQPKVVGLYDPYDATNLEYRAYIGYKEGDTYNLGLRKGESVTIQVPLVFWDAGRILFASDGSDLVPLVDRVAPPSNQPNSPNPFHYHDFQNFVITQAVLDTLAGDPYKVPASVTNGLSSLIAHGPFVDITAFKAAARAAVNNNEQYGKYEIPILNVAGAVVPTKRFRDDLPDGVHAVLWYRAQGPSGLAEGPAGSAPAQLGEMTFRSTIFADPRFLTHKNIDPDGKSGEVHNLVNYDVSYVDSMMLPVAMQANNVPLDPSGSITKATAPYGWVGADKTLGDLQGPLATFTSKNTQAAPNQNGLGQYFGGEGYPRYYIPPTIEALTGIKVPAGQNLALESPITDGRSAWDQNEFILTSAGVGPISVSGTGLPSSSGGVFEITFNNATDVKALKQVTPAEGWSITVNGVLDVGNSVISTTFKTVNGGEVAVVQIQKDVAGGLHTYEFKRPIEDYVITKLANLWFSWADHYYDAFKNVAPDPSYSGTIAPKSNELVFTNAVAADKLVVGMPVSGPGVPSTLQATILEIVLDPDDSTKATSIKLSKLSEPGGSGTDFHIDALQRIRPQNSVGFAVAPYTMGFTTAPEYAVSFARSVYVVLAAMNTVPVSSATAPAIVELMANSLGGNIGFIPNIGVIVKSNDHSKVEGNQVIATVIRDAVKSVLRGVDDFQVDTEDKGNWYPDPSLTGDLTGQKINGANATFNVYNLNPFVWFVHKKLGLSGYGFSLDDDAADVGADGATELRVVIGSFEGLPEDQFYHAEWTHGAPYGPVKSQSGTLSLIDDKQSQYYNMYQLTGLDMAPLPIVLQVLGTGPSGEAGALVSGPGIAPGTRALFANVGGNGVILDSPATIPNTPSGPYFFSGTPPKVATPASAVPDGSGAWDLSVLGADGFYGEPSLTYTWSLLSGPAGGTATFSTNGTNAAKQSEVTLSKVPGTYVIQVAIAQQADVGGFFTTSKVTIVRP